MQGFDSVLVGNSPFLDELERLWELVVTDWTLLMVLFLVKKLLTNQTLIASSKG